MRASLAAGQKRHLVRKIAENGKAFGDPGHRTQAGELAGDLQYGLGRLLFI